MENQYKHSCHEWHEYKRQCADAPVEVVLVEEGLSGLHVGGEVHGGKDDPKREEPDQGEAVFRFGMFFERRPTAALFWLIWKELSVFAPRRHFKEDSSIFVVI